MLETTMLRWIDAWEERAPDAETARDAATAREGGRRTFMVGRAGPHGSWARVAPDSEPARRFLPGPFSLAMLLRGRPAAGSSV